jgi:hypothetical protein
MKYKLQTLTFSVLLLTVLHGAMTGQSPDNKIPYLSGTGSSKHLIADGKPFIMLAGELHNSSASGSVYMEPVWERLTGLNLNTVLASVSWELIEPEEGKFDFSNVDMLLSKARQNNLKLVLLWFGTWKNACSSYAPAWVRQDTKKFKRSESAEGKKLNNISCLSAEASNADSKAFGALMKHLKEVDGTINTVLAIQVENEAGIRGDSRDRSPMANNAFQQAVPVKLMDFLMQNKEKLNPEMKQIWAGSGFKKRGKWEEIFSKDADLVFMAWNTASYIEKVAAAGKAEYPLPMYANAWLDTEGSVAGDFPSGGPISRMISVWQAAAPHIDLLAPDIYRSDFDRVCDMFQQMGNALFIPEVMPDSLAAAKAFYAIGQGAICFSPFAIDDNRYFKQDDDLGNNYLLLSRLMPYFQKYQGTEQMAGFIGKSGEEKVLRMGNFKLRVNFTGDHNSRLPGYGLVIALSGDEYLVAGKGFTISFLSESGVPGRTEILSAYDMIYQNKSWARDRRLNGDETGEGSDHNIQLRFTENNLNVRTAKVFHYE